MNLRLLSVITMLALLLTSCSSAEPQERRDIPIPPNLDYYNGPEETTLDGMWVATMLSREKMPKQRDTVYYWLPNTIEWQTIEQFYQENLDPSWQQDADIPLISGARWTRSSSAGTQILVLNEIGIAAEEGRILVMFLVTE